jgi:hypothetical protein
MIIFDVSIDLNNEYHFICLKKNPPDTPTYQHFDNKYDYFLIYIIL